jgi:hypothetical protein
LEAGSCRATQSQAEQRDRIIERFGLTSSAILAAER